MANALYPLWKEKLLQAVSGTALTGTLKAALVDTNIYSYNAADEFYTAISSAVVGTPQTINSKTYAGGTLDGDDITFNSLVGASIEAIVLYLDTGTPGTSRLVSYNDTGVGGLPFTPSGSSVIIRWNAAGIFKLGA